MMKVTLYQLTVSPAQQPDTQKLVFTFKPMPAKVVAALKAMAKDVFNNYDPDDDDDGYRQDLVGERVAFLCRCQDIAERMKPIIGDEGVQPVSVAGTCVGAIAFEKTEAWAP